jgi:four helix bundle protein
MKGRWKMGDAQCKSYRNLVVWQKSMELAEKIYLVTRNFPKEEIYALTSQGGRSAVSVPSNIADSLLAYASYLSYFSFLRLLS